jgi:low temperature requirement protein LtrA
MWGLSLTLTVFWGAIPLTLHINKLGHSIPTWAMRRNVFSTALMASSVPLAYVSVYLAWFVIMTLPVLYGVPNKVQMGIFDPKTGRLAGF